MTPATLLHEYDLIDIVGTRNDRAAAELESWARPVIGSDEFRRALQIYATAVVEYGSNVLNGDFTDFEAADAIVKVRARAAAIQKWGAQASNFGW